MIEVQVELEQTLIFFACVCEDLRGVAWSASHLCGLAAG